MDRAKLEALEKLLAEATPGPWIHDRDMPCNEGRRDDPDLSLWVAGAKKGDDFLCNIAFDLEHEHDAELICALRNAAPALLRLARSVADAPRVELAMRDNDRAQYWLECDDCDNVLDWSAMNALDGKRVLLLRADAADTTAGDAEPEGRG